MNLSQLLPKLLTLLTTGGGAGVLFDPSNPPTVRIGAAIGAAVVVALYNLGHHHVEAAKAAAAGTVAAAKVTAGATAGAAAASAAGTLHDTLGALSGMFPQAPENPKAHQLPEVPHP